MTACHESLQQCAYIAETASVAGWGETSTDMTGAQILPISARFNFDNLQREMLRSSRVVALKDEVPKGIPGPASNLSFTVELEIVGHGSTTSGATALTAVGDFFGWALGAAVASAAAGTTVSATNTAVALTTTASGTFGAGTMFREGAAADTRGNGQWNNVASHVTNTLTGKVAFDGAPINTDVVYSAESIYTLSSSCEMASMRFRLLSMDIQVVAHGCWVKSRTISGYNPGEIPKLVVEIGVSWAEPVSVTFPDVTSTSPWSHNPVPVAAGSIHIQDFGTTTRNVLEVWSVAINLQQGIFTAPTYTGKNTAQVIGGARRTPDTIGVTFMVPATGPSAAPAWRAKFLAVTTQQAMLSLSCGAGAAWACYFRKLQWAGKEPLQMSFNGQNAIQLDFLASSDSAGATEAAKAAMIWGLA